MATVLNRDELTELATLVPLIRALQEASDAHELAVPADALDLLKQRLALILGKLKKA